ncbi:MAG: nucleotidyltransferase family protein [Butyrivibrio sp.]|uniref:nucleotidyltransferase domain-containing protein n=1 Tax=Butyrivibrio sp. TaxID=28121 RepID=UPI0025FB8EC0|nr:nucleotidyltransferase family protein [Butyrivibrio sp.]MCR5772121.1 nucleotidyltransferase family protein [Butyrivibrio sp.]
MTSNTIDNLFMLCRAHMYSNDKTESENDKYELDFEELKVMIQENSLSAFLYKPVKEFNDKNGIISQEVIADYGRYIQAVMFRELSKNYGIKKLCKEAENRGIRLVFFKGILLADLYPQYAERTSSDSDILVDDKDKEAAEKLLVELGYEKNLEHSKNHVQVYSNNVLDHVVELHTRLWEDYTGPRIDILDKMELSCLQTDIRTMACGIEVNTLGYEKHLVYQLFHIIKHFSLDGIGIRYLIDTTLFVNRYCEDIDFDLFWKHIELLGYTKFVEAFFQICVKELKMTDKVFENHAYMLDHSVDDLKMDLLKVGITKDKDAGWQIMGAMEGYFTGEAKAPKTEIKRKLSMVFPSLDALPKTYIYARRYPILLPFAWVHRAIKFIIRRNGHKEAFYSVSEKIDVGERRIHLMDELGLMRND